MPSLAPLLRHRLGWLAGLPALALVGTVTAYLATPRIEDDLAQAAAAVSRGTGEGQPEPWLRVTVRGRDLVAAGEAPDAAQRAAALERLTALDGPRRLIDRTGVIEDASPFVWSAERAGPERVAVTGSRPAEVGAFELAQRLKPALPEAGTLDDQTRAARGAPPDFPDAAAFAVERLRDLTTGSVATLDDTVISIRGEAASTAAYESFRTALATPPAGFTIGTVTVLPPVVTDLHLTIERRPDGSLELGGDIASAEARAAMRAAAAEAAEGAAVDDRMRDARGAGRTPDSTALAPLMLKLAGLLHAGRVAYGEGRLSVEGSALDAAAVGEIETTLRDGRPAGVSPGRIALTERPLTPYVLRLRRGGDSVTLSGHLPDAQARDALLARLRPRLFREAIRDRTRLADGAPEGFAIALAAAIDPFSTLESGELAVSGPNLRLTGTSLYPESAARLSQTLPRAMPTGWTAAVAVSGGEPSAPLGAQDCRRRLTERVAAHPLRFAPGSTALAPDFYPVLDAVAALARDCPTERIEVVGHLDPPDAKPAAAPAGPIAAEAARESAPKPPAKKDARPAKGEKAEKGKAEMGKAEKAPEKAQEKVQEKAPETAQAPPETGAGERVEAGADLARARALAVVDYLQKAGVPMDRALPSAAAPLSDRQGIGLGLRS